MISHKAYSLLTTIIQARDLHQILPKNEFRKKSKSKLGFTKTRINYNKRDKKQTNRKNSPSSDVSSKATS